MRGLTALFLSCAMPVMAQDFSLEMPVDCDLGSTCYIQNYVDHDPTEGASDFRCSPLTYDTHKGTDFALVSLAAMEAGVDVNAAASGTVQGVRDEMRDVLYTPAMDAEINGRDCGNGVVVAHENGWETQYCHLKQGSITVQSGEMIEAGDNIGQIGLSGRTQFPHLHLSVRQNGQVVDPFIPDGTVTCDAPATDTLWTSDINTPDGGLISTGFALDVPDYDAVKAGTAAVTRLHIDMPIVLWTFLFGAQEGDTIVFSITGPDGPFFDADVDLDRTQALVMRAAGRNAPDEGWPSGTYSGTAIHMRRDRELGRQTVTISVP